jgi:hypothetical protein
MASQAGAEFEGRPSRSSTGQDMWGFKQRTLADALSLTQDRLR